MVQVKYFAGINEEGQKMVESVLCDWCDWILKKSDEKKPGLRCYRNNLSDPITIIQSADVIAIQNVFEGSEG